MKTPFYFAVITEVPEDGDGNLACNELHVVPHSRNCVVGSNLVVGGCDLDSERGAKLFADCLRRDRNNNEMIDLSTEQIVMCNSPVFQLGEILIMDPSNDRSVPEGRKPDKWNVSYERFSELTVAIKRSLEVYNKGDGYEWQR